MQKKTRIMVVEDEPTIRTDVAELLTEFGYEVCGQASRGEEAVAMADRLEPDLVLMDIQLEGEMDGVTAAGMIRSSLRTPVIFLTAFADEKTLSRAKITEPYGYVLKPYKPLELRTVIELALYKLASLPPPPIIEDEPKPTKKGVVKMEESSATILEEIPVEGQVAIAEGKSKINVDTLYDRMRSVEPFSKLSPTAVRRMLSHANLMAYEASELICLEGDKGVSGFMVLSGRVALVKSSISGKDLIVDLLYPGDPFGLIVALDKQPYPFTTKAQVKSELIWIPKSVLLASLDEDQALSRSFLQKILDRLRFAHDTSRGLARERVEVRIASTLISLLQKSEEARVWQGERERSKVIEMTRQELADLVGSTEETTIRITKALERDGVLDLTTPRAIKVLDRRALEMLATE